MTLVDLVSLVLATGAVVDVWNNGSIFAGARQEVRTRVAAGSGTFIERMMDCWFCLSHHAPVFLILLTIIPGLIWESFAPWSRLLLYSLAATRASVLINQLVPDRARYESAE